MLKIGLLPIYIFTGTVPKYLLWVRYGVPIIRVQI
jgi:hypothetical protein